MLVCAVPVSSVFVCVFWVFTSFTPSSTAQPSSGPFQRRFKTILATFGPKPSQDTPQLSKCLRKPLNEPVILPADRLRLNTALQEAVCVRAHSD
jgi:hypothetical protein